MAEFTKEQLIEDLRKIGVVEGDHLGVGLSFKSIGSVLGGPDALIDAFLEAVGPEGTIMIPANTRSFPLYLIESGQVDYIFNYRSTRPYTGLVPDTLRKRAGAIRSRHPICSVVALGSLAEYLTEGHDDKSQSYLPYSRLAEAEGKILSIGIGDRLVSFRHEAQYKAGLLDVVPLRHAVKYISEEGTVELFIQKESQCCVKRLPGLVDIMRERGLITDGTIGMANSVLVPAREGLNMMTELLRSDPTLNLCDDVRCLWCRELERRLDLYKRINNPKYFQKNILAMNVLALINGLRLGDGLLITSIRQFRRFLNR